MKAAKVFKKLSGGVVQCQACSWYCRIAPGNLGVCATRLNKNGRLYSLVYGQIVGPALDPVEKKPLYHFLPGSNLLSFGTVGCNFACTFCQNWEQSQGNKTGLKINTTKITPEELVDLALSQHASGIAYTYNEPAIFVEFAHDTAVLAKKKGLKNVYVSNGFESVETFNYLKPYLDAINIDLKSFSAKFYQTICKAKIEPVKANIKRFFQSGIATEITTLIIPNHNDSVKELTQIAKFLYQISPDIPWHLSAFHPDYKMTDIPVTPHSTLIKACQIGKKSGLHYIYIGNVFDPKHSSTICPHCQILLISRSHYVGQIENLNTKTGRCSNCGYKIYGVWH
ncbi:MAG: AmmeMemoRadiSam system radical SAM enzyme [Candidatus Beckwithbacteria bacterium]|nr:AmmeMemoRadiSam system radical SAM enzyme [Candidatus Beckwithbacteria bacterium]